jgi:hypothetical protein
VLSKLFKRKSSPTKGGSEGQSDLDKMDYVKVFEIELSNMEGAPVYPLEGQVIVGSEVGDILISDPSIAPRHATFTLQDDVVSIIDHGSSSGTFINGKKISTGKNVILEESDKIGIGDLEVKIVVKKNAVKREEVPETPGSETKDAREEATKLRVYTPKSLTNPPAPKEKKAKLNKKINKKKALVLSAPTHSTNAILRVFAVLSDLILSYSLIVILMPFDDFRGFLEFVPGEISALLDIDWQQFKMALIDEYPILGEILGEATSQLAADFNFYGIIIVYFVLRFASTIILGVSVSEFFLGIRSTGNFIWARVGGPIRVVVGMLTWPFIIFDLTSILSRRTLKEFLTFTNIHTPSAFSSILGILFYVPVIFCIAVISPLIQGFEPPVTVSISDKIDQRVKSKVLKDNVEEAEAQFEPKVDVSDFLKFQISYNPSELLILPTMHFRGVKEKLNLNTSLTFYQRDLQRPIEVEVFKTFDFKQLLGIGIKGNYLLFEKYPKIHHFVYESNEAKSVFKKHLDAKSQMSFATEIIKFTKTAFSLNAENALEVIETETPFIKGYIDYKNSFLSLIEYKDFHDISFLKIGNALFMKISYNKQKPFDLIIPLVMGEGRIFKVNFDKKDNIKAVSTKFYKYNLDDSNWIDTTKNVQSDSMTTLKVFDLLSAPKLKTVLQSPDSAQSLYAYIFELSAELVKRGDSIELELWKSDLSNLSKLLEVLPKGNVSEGQESSVDKLRQNVNDVMDAIENSNLEYFGASDTVSA